MKHKKGPIQKEVYLSMSNAKGQIWYKIQSRALYA